jgi:NACalpha-BTF3-like transcription factor
MPCISGEAGTMNINRVKQTIRALGLTVTRVDGEWRVNYQGGKEATAYYTDDPQAALDTARAMVMAVT